MLIDKQICRNSYSYQPPVQQQSTKRKKSIYSYLNKIHNLSVWGEQKKFVEMCIKSNVWRCIVIVVVGDLVRRAQILKHKTNAENKSRSSATKCTPLHNYMNDEVNNNKNAAHQSRFSYCNQCLDMNTHYMGGAMCIMTTR